MVGCAAGADGAGAVGVGAGAPGWPGNWLSVTPVSDAPAPFCRNMKKRGPCSASWAVPAIAPTVARTAIAANIFFPARTCRPFVSGLAVDLPGLAPGRVAGPAGLVPGPAGLAGLVGLAGRVAGPAGLTGAVAGLTGLDGAEAGAGIVARPPGLSKFLWT